MAEKVDIWMPFYIRDYLADTGRLTTEQHGGYMLLIFDYWMLGALPDDDEVLQRITKMSADSWAASGPVLRAMFSKGADGRLFHKRIEKELEKARASRQIAVSRAKKAAQSRWGGNASSNAPSNAQSIPDIPDTLHGTVLGAMLEECPSPSPSQSSSQSSSQSGSVRREHLRTSSLSTAGAADRPLPFFANVVLSPEESNAKWSARRYQNFWNRRVSSHFSVKTMSKKWVRAIESWGDHLTPGKFLGELKRMERTQSIQSSRDFYTAMNSVVAGVPVSE